MCAAQKIRLRRADCSGQWKRRPAVRAALTTAPPHRSNPMSARTAVCSADRSAWSAGTITATLPHSAAPYPRSRLRARGAWGDEKGADPRGQRPAGSQ